MSEKIIQFNEDVVKQQVGTLVRESVEATLNKLLGAEQSWKIP
ncbi:hypothetical protein [Parasphaerochaeta coccoides]|uniref:Transposase mutator type n=1 Tax=Parasphaerochaeta coccoides (strain ATCC BAA-1237 / DSM 17374 / SPN1) TaxID=760011 RepID=F4GL33_PARC1|nr:hypothetical protein [Parasphaerochaeta coccoides]AEC02373.1 transposase mutator type [Parasphaerochaeta coccoides DSM 17374]